MNLLERPQGRIAYDLYGEDNGGPLIVCIPGMADHRATYRFLGPALAEEGFRVAAMDLRGHGDSDATFDAYDDAAAGSDVTALVEELGGGPAVLVGNSMGAAASVWTAATRPELVAGLVLIGPFVRDPRTSAAAGFVMKVMLMRPWGPAMLTGYFTKLNAGRTPDGFDRHTALVRAGLRPADRYRAVMRTVATSHTDVEALIGEVGAPVLVVMGELDPDWTDPKAEAEWVAERLDGTVLMVPDSGHYPQAQRPDLVSPAITEFAAASAGARDA